MNNKKEREIEKEKRRKEGIIKRKVINNNTLASAKGPSKKASVGPTNLALIFNCYNNY